MKINFYQRGIQLKFIAVVFIFNTSLSAAQDRRGAVIPWTTYEAEHMRTTGTKTGPGYNPYKVETESSGQQCVKLNADKQFIEFTTLAKANATVIRYSLPDTKDGSGSAATLGVYKNGKLLQSCKVSSRYSWLYGKYPFSNDPSMGVPRHFYDEVRLKDLTIEKGDLIRIQLDRRQGDNAGYCIIDLVDLENLPPPISAPANSLSIADKMFRGADFDNDYTNAFNSCIARAVKTGKSVWIPAGTFKITGDIVLPSNITIQGAGMWYTNLVGDDSGYTDANKRVRLIGRGSNIHIADFAITGKLNYRSDREANDGIVGAYGTNSSIARIWIEHTKVGMWIENSSGLVVSGCRLRNTMADGINFCVGMNRSTIENCTARGTGDDCFAIWPTVFMKQLYSPGHNLIIHCTAQLPFLANGAAVYGGDSNQIKDCSFSDITQGSAILISTTFPTENKDKSINNNFSGTTVIEDCDISTSGGFDHEWGWRAAIEICLDKRDIAGVEINDVNISRSLSNAVSVVGSNKNGKSGILSNAMLSNVTISGYGIGTKGKQGLFIAGNAQGRLGIKNSHIPEIHNESSNFMVVK